MCPEIDIRPITGSNYTVNMPPQQPAVCSAFLQKRLMVSPLTGISLQHASVAASYCQTQVHNIWLSDILFGPIAKLGQEYLTWLQRRHELFLSVCLSSQHPVSLAMLLYIEVGYSDPDRQPDLINHNRQYVLFEVDPIVSVVCDQKLGIGFNHPAMRTSILL